MSLVTFEKSSPHTGRITLHDPENLNAMSEAMADEFAALTKSIKKQAKQLRALILTGSGRAFSAGGDLAMLEAKQKKSAKKNRDEMLGFYGSFLGLLELGIPTIAAINGHAVGAGLCIAAGCDVRIAAKGAKLGFTFVKLGLHPGMGATYFLPRVIGHAAATELMITGRLIEAEEALQLGLISKIVEPSEILKSAESIAEEIAACGPEAVRDLLLTLRAGQSTLASALKREAQCQASSYASDEFKEGVRAAIEKRKPRF